MRLRGTVVFWLLLVVHCACIYLEMPLARSVSKSLLLPVLIVYLLALSGKTRGNTRLAVAGLFCSWIGDLLLIGDGAFFFLGGMLGFMIAHLSYSLYFIRTQALRFSKSGYFIASVFLLQFLCSTVYHYTSPSLGNYRIPVLLYMVIISLMVSLAANLLVNPLLRKTALFYFIPGAFVFALSDSLLALNMFYLHKPLLGIGVMLTYGAGQWFLVKGFIKQGL